MGFSVQTKNFSNKILSPFSIGIITSRFNEPITQALYEGAIARLNEYQFTDEHIKAVWVPGAIEIPVVAQRFAKSKKYQALICLGAVIRGETTHYDYVCQCVSEGCSAVALQYDLPVIFGVLTTENEEQAWQRAGGPHGHKGSEAADAAIEMVLLLQNL